MNEQSGGILVGIDFSEGSERALRHAAGLARRLGTRLHLGHCHQIRVVAVPQGILAPAEQEMSLPEIEEDLRELSDRVVGDAAPVEIHARLDSPVPGLLALIDELSPELVVAGRHGRGAVMRLLLGSVSEALCQRSPVPVLVVPAGAGYTGSR